MKASASVFAALGDATRLTLLSRLAAGNRQSIARLTQGTSLSRQAVTKHLRVLESAGVVHSLRAGRESQFEFDPKSIEDVRIYLEDVSRQWDGALGRLRALVERE